MAVENTRKNNGMCIIQEIILLIHTWSECYWSEIFYMKLLFCLQDFKEKWTPGLLLF